MPEDVLSTLPMGVLVIAALLLTTLAVVGGVLVNAIYGPRARLRRRVAAVVGGGAGRGKMGKVVAGNKRRSVQSKLKELEGARARKRRNRLREDLLQAGLEMSVRKFLALSAVFGLVSAGACIPFGLPPITLPLVGITMGVGVPKLVLRMLIERRRKKFLQVFPDALDIIVRGIRSGLPVIECIAMIGREMPDPVGTEFRTIAESQRIGLPLDEALEKAVERIPVSELRFFAIVLTVQQQTGGNLSDTLSKLSDVLRQRKKMRDKIEAMSSEAKASAMIVGSLPIAVSLMLLVVAPGYIMILFSSTTGNVALAAGVGLMAFGSFVMRQMINFDF